MAGRGDTFAVLWDLQAKYGDNQPLLLGDVLAGPIGDTNKFGIITGTFGDYVDGKILHGSESGVPIGLTRMFSHELAHYLQELAGVETSH